MASEVSAEEIFKEFKEHSISEFFRRNSQMLGYAGKVRSLTTIVHEYVTNSIDASEEASILPEIKVEIKELGENKYSVRVADNGPGIPSRLVGKALATVLSGTKFHRYVQQRGQQGIGASGCTLFSKITTGKPIHVRSATQKEAYECDITIDIKSNRPLVEHMQKRENGHLGLEVYGEFGDVKYEESDHGVYEYLKRTALSNPHLSIKLTEPDGKEIVFIRSSQVIPERPRPIKPHPLGISTTDLLEFAHSSASRKLSSFLIDTFSRTTQNKVSELKEIVKEIDFEKDPKGLSWTDAEKLVDAFKQVRWIAPELESLSTIGEKQIGETIKNILNPKFISVVERKPKVFHGGVPFVVEVGIAFGGGAGREVKEKEKGEVGKQAIMGGNILRFANKVPLLFDGSSCAITEATRSVEWKRYAISNFDEEPISVLVNVSSVHVPYAGVGKQAIAGDEEMMEEIKLAVMEAGRNLQRYISGVRNVALQESKYKTIMRYVSQLSKDLGDITGEDHEKVELSLKSLIEKRYKPLFGEKTEKIDGAPEASGEEKEEDEE